MRYLKIIEHFLIGFLLFLSGLLAAAATSPLLTEVAKQPIVVHIHQQRDMPMALLAGALLSLIKWLEIKMQTKNVNGKQELDAEIRVRPDLIPKR